MNNLLPEISGPESFVNFARMGQLPIIIQSDRLEKLLCDANTDIGIVDEALLLFQMDEIPDLWMIHVENED